MKCYHCKKKAIVQYTQALCRKCFLKLLEARVRKYVRINKFFNKNDIILVIDPLSKFLLKKIIGGLPVKIYYRKIKILNLDKIKGYINDKKIKKIVIPWTIDDECCFFLEKLFQNKSIKKNTYISLLQVMTDDEAISFAKFNKIAFSPNKKDQEIKNMLDILEKKYPETKYSFIKSIAETRKILNK